MGDYTFKGLSAWYASLFEKFGWVTLNKDLIHSDGLLKSVRNGAALSAVTRSRVQKLLTYVATIQQCVHAIQIRLKAEKDASKRVDLSIMHKNLVHLESRAEDLVREFRG